MADSPRSEAHLYAAWRDVVAGVEALCADVRIHALPACREGRGPFPAVGAGER